MTLSQLPPNISAAARANGLLEPASWSLGMIPMIATIATMSTIVASSVPMIVARGMLRYGSLTSSAATVASIPPFPRSP